MNSPALKKLAAFVLAVLLLVYVGYQVYNANYSSVRTETASAFTTAESVKVTGTAIRRETVIENAPDGVVTYTVQDGGKVNKGGVVAQVYPDAQSAAAQQQIAQLDAQIVRMERLASPGETYSADQTSLAKQINQKLSQTLYSLVQCDYGTVSVQKEDLLYLVNERQIVTQQAGLEVFSARKTALEQERAALAASSKVTGSVKAPVSGYFISGVDGYEAVFNPDFALKLTVDELKAGQAAPLAVGGQPGKICSDFGWYFAALVPAEDVARFKEGRGVSLEFPFGASKPVSAQVVAINQEGRGTDAVVVLSCTTMNSSLARLRNETAQIQIAQYSGIRISQKAVRFETLEKQVTDEDGVKTTVRQEVQGVYALHGSEIEFRQIVPLYSSGSYVVCDPDPPAETLFTKSTVKLYDEVVVEGTDLFDGKVIR